MDIVTKFDLPSAEKKNILTSTFKESLRQSNIGADGKILIYRELKMHVAETLVISFFLNKWFIQQTEWYFNNIDLIY